LVACSALFCLVPPSGDHQAACRVTTTGHESVVLLTAADGRYCTGSLVLPNAVLTAAHCLEDLGPDELRVTVGNEDHRVDQLLIHPDYRPGESAAPDPADVAIVAFLPRGVSSPALPISSRAMRRGEEVTFVGFGDSRTSRANEPLIKRIGNDRYMPGNRWSASGLENSVATAERGRGLLYFESGPSDVGGSPYGAAATRGDSGGPVFGENGAIVGVLIAVSQVRDVETPHRVTWAVDIQSPSVRSFLASSFRKLAARAVA
jgi:hypothetical protein